MITPKQIALVRAGVVFLCGEFNDFEYRAILRGSGGVDSIKDLDAAGLDRVMAYFNSFGFRPERFHELGRRRGMASPAQLQLLRDLWADWAQHSNTEAALNRWLERSFQVSTLRFLNAATASKAINALRAMAKRGSEPSRKAR